jgi:hypothetical protein
VLAASIISTMMEAASTTETSLNLYQTTRRNNPEDSHRHTRRRENLKSYLEYLLPCPQNPAFRPHPEPLESNSPFETEFL